MWKRNKRRREDDWRRRFIKEDWWELWGMERRVRKEDYERNLDGKDRGWSRRERNK